MHAGRGEEFLSLAMAAVQAFLVGMAHGQHQLKFMAAFEAFKVVIRHALILC